MADRKSRNQQHQPGSPSSASERGGRAGGPAADRNRTDREPSSIADDRGLEPHRGVEDDLSDDGLDRDESAVTDVEDIEGIDDEERN